ncbi:cell division protein FtsA [Caldanaerobius fijiensis DSM 17918]|uniref:Cell division protein FtsA n=1 Tax=Caldanaerobius fijiensis DSM 17918 TaxID=1121256 RepID=A0A1M4T1S0_9THEO|nr:cell division protein FtsA [Caldanaerobius fijiensis]SHE38419.1 cell division protein FtsA [Caldanaerobius fijiensis DSM 17918]
MRETDSNVVLGLDIGTSKICAVAGQRNRNGETRIVGVGLSSCKGIKRGVVVDIDSTVKSINEAVNQVRQMSNMDFEEVNISIVGGHASLVENKGVIAVSRDDREITEEDVNRVLQAAKVVALPSDREIIDIIPQQYIVDGYDGIKDPVGMIGVRLEVDAKIITGNITSVENLVRSVNKAGLKVKKIILEPLATAEILLTRDEKELGVALVDVGAGKTSVSIFKNGHLIDTYLLPIGGEHITNDIAQGFKISIQEAEQIKIKYGCAGVFYVKEDETIKLPSVGNNVPKEISRVDLAYIMEARIQEILLMINKVITEAGYRDEITSGIVLTGGGIAFIPGCLEYAVEVIGMPIRVDYPKIIGVASPIYSVATGIVEYILKNTKYKPEKKETVANKNIRHNYFINKLKEIFSDFF